MRRGIVLAPLLALAVLGGCGLPDDDAPRLIAAEDAPLDLAPSTVPAADPEVGDDSIAVFFMNQDTDTLQAVGRAVPAPTPEAAIEQLLRVGTTPEDPPALVSSIPPGTLLLSASLEGETLTLDLGAENEGGITSVGGDQQLQAFAQIVRTATGLPGIRNVRFLVDGTPLDAPTDAGPSSEPVDRDDYASLAP